MKNKFLILVVSFFISVLTSAHEFRDLLQKQASPQQVKANLLPDRQWIKYPAYNNRAGWDALTGAFKEDIIKKGEQYLAYEWKVVKASDYLEFERSGSRQAMENPAGANNQAFSRLVFAELAEGKGRFLDQIINGVWLYCEMTSWASSAHLVAQKNRRALPDPAEQLIDLGGSDMGSFLSWTWYFLHGQFDNVNPVIAARLRTTLYERILNPYMTRSDYWWQAFNAKPTTLVNNWNAWCNFNVLSCFLLLEEDPDKLAAAVYRTMTSVDKFINYNHDDGACEEGPSYWGHAAGKLYDYLQLLSDATNGKVNIFHEPMIRNMGEYISRSYVGNGWVVNFADASAKGGGDAGLIFRYGKAVGSTEMQQFAAYLVSNRQGQFEIYSGRDFFRTLENLSTYEELSKTNPGLSAVPFTWYPQTQFCYMKNKSGFFFAAKGGYNNESHNHNDVGSFALYLNETPLLIDAGVGTYTRQTFSSERYNIWTMQSNYHNVPLINGWPQKFGSMYRAKDVAFDPKKARLTMDISGAYGKEAEVSHWKRTYTLAPSSGLTIEDQFSLTAAKAPNQVNFLTWGKPDVSKAGEVTIEKEGKRIRLRYDAAQFTPSVETIPQTDTRLSRVWGAEIYRLSLTAKAKAIKGRYKFVVTKL